jgi:hypothetical protein
VHWASGQEIALRLVAWLFALDTLLVRGLCRTGQRAIGPPWQPATD